jgi:hypothetical protein
VIPRPHVGNLPSPPDVRVQLRLRRAAERQSGEAEVESSLFVTVRGPIRSR